jgi:hypothetical protein
MNMFWMSEELMNVNIRRAISQALLAPITEYIETEGVCMQYYGCNSHTDYNGCSVR